MRTPMLDERKAAILRAVVEEYIETAQPVGSAHVVRGGHLNVSAATVRNEMAALEADGFLRQPHTSAGRVPTNKGYRFFVDHLAGPPNLAPLKAHQVRSFFAKAHGELEQILAETTHLLASLTDYAAVVVGPPHEAATIRSVQLVGLTGQIAVVVLVLSDGAVEKRTVELESDVDADRLAAAGARLAAHLTGAPAGLVPSVPSTGDPATDRLTAAVVHALGRDRHGDADSVFVGGTSRMAASFDGVEAVRQVLSILEQQYVVVSLLRDVLDRGLNVAIGAETGLEPLAECSVVVAPYRAETEGGTIAVLGPTRMDYPQAMAAVAVVSRRLGRRLSEG